MTKTEHYNLNQWEPDDPVRRTDFNEDNAKIDAALADKAEAAELKALQAAVSGKAEAATLAALQTIVSGKGNCRLATGSYTGTGTAGVSAPSSLSFAFQPVLVVITGAEGSALLIRGAAECKALMGVAYAYWTLTWSGNTVSWYVTRANLSNSASYPTEGPSQMNEKGKVYHYAAFGMAGS